MKVRTGIGGACILAISVCSNGLAGGGAAGLLVDTRVNADSVTVGQRLQVIYHAEYPESLALVPSAEFESGNCRILSLSWHDETPAPGRRMREARVTAITLDLERAYLPPVPFRFISPSGDTLTVMAGEVSVPVYSLVGEKTDARPLKPQWRAPRSFFYAYVAAGVLGLLALAVWLWRRRRRAPAEAPDVPELPADYLALQALQRIAEMQLVEKGKIKKHYTLITDAVRRYLERRYGVLAMDRTSVELLDELSAIDIRIEGVEPLLAEADLVKFAKLRPDRTRAKNVLEEARDIVVRTAPRPRVAGE